MLNLLVIKLLINSGINIMFGKVKFFFQRINIFKVKPMKRNMKYNDWIYDLINFYKSPSYAYTPLDIRQHLVSLEYYNADEIIIRAIVGGILVIHTLIPLNLALSHKGGKIWGTL